MSEPVAFTQSEAKIMIAQDETPFIEMRIGTRIRSKRRLQVLLQQLLRATSGAEAEVIERTEEQINARLKEMQAMPPAFVRHADDTKSCGWGNTTSEMNFPYLTHNRAAIQCDTVGWKVVFPDKPAARQVTIDAAVSILMDYDRDRMANAPKPIPPA